MKTVALAILLAMGGAGVRGILQGIDFYLENSSAYPEQCWVDFINGRRTEVFMPPYSTSRKWLEKSVDDWGCY